VRRRSRAIWQPHGHMTHSMVCMRWIWVYFRRGVSSTLATWLVLMTVHCVFGLAADTTYTVSGPRDHYRQQTVAGGFAVEKAPVYPSMFSELPHFPATTYRWAHSTCGNGFDGKALPFASPQRGPSSASQTDGHVPWPTRVMGGKMKAMLVCEHAQASYATLVDTLAGSRTLTGCQLL
jgi:hypothetical protein